MFVNREFYYQYVSELLWTKRARRKLESAVKFVQNAQRKLSQSYFNWKLLENGLIYYLVITLRIYEQFYLISLKI